MFFQINVHQLPVVRTNRNAPLRPSGGLAPGFLFQKALHGVGHVRMAAEVGTGFTEAFMVPVKHRIAEMGKIHPVRKLLHQQVRSVGIKTAQGSGTEREAGMRGGNFTHHPAHVLLIAQDTGQPEDGPGRIVRMNGHADARFLAHGHDFIQEIVQVPPQLRIVYALIALEHLPELLRRQVIHRTGKPQQDGIRQRLAGASVHGLEKFAGARRRLRGIILRGPFPFQNKQVKRGHADGVILQDAAAVLHGKGQVGTRPVQHGHEIVAHHFHAAGGQIAQALLVNVQVMLPVPGTRLDVFMNGDAFRHYPLHASLFNHPRAFGHGLPRPQFPALYFMQGRHDSVSARLADVPQRHRVVWAVPSPALNHIDKN